MLTSILLETTGVAAAQVIVDLDMGQNTAPARPLLAGGRRSLLMGVVVAAKDISVEAHLLVIAVHVMDTGEFSDDAALGRSKLVFD
jgi:hypothetical protein